MRRRLITHDVHPFHIVGECQDCCDESEALRTGYEGPLRQQCDSHGCPNWPGYEKWAEEVDEAADLDRRADVGWLG